MPLFALAAAMLAFGLATVFWVKPADEPAAVLSAGFTVLLALVAFLWKPVYPRLSPLAALVLALVGGAQVFLGAPLALSVLAGVGFIAAGAFAFLASRDRSSALRAGISRDLVITAVVLAADGIILLFVRDLGAHGQLGIAGGAAIIVGVLWLISGISLRLDAGKEG